jgi:hypothetical protein
LRAAFSIKQQESGSNSHYKISISRANHRSNSDTITHHAGNGNHKITRLQARESTYTETKAKQKQDFLEVPFQPEAFCDE